MIPQTVLDKRGKDFGVDINTFFHHQLDIATPMWNSPVVAFANDQIKKATSAILTKKASPKDALSAAQTASQAELQRVLKTK